MLLTGKFTHSLDEKGRLALPSELRAKLAPHQDNLWITRDLAIDDALALVTGPVFEQESAKLLAKDSDDPYVAEQLDLFVGNARQVQIGNNGRIQIPKELRDDLELEPGSEVMVAGLGSKVVIRSKAVYDSRVPKNPPRRSAAQGSGQ